MFRLLYLLLITLSCFLLKSDRAHAAFPLRQTTAPVDTFLALRSIQNVEENHTYSKLSLTSGIISLVLLLKELHQPGGTLFGIFSGILGLFAICIGIAGLNRGDNVAAIAGMSIGAISLLLLLLAGGLT
jgi:hypothetical protein